MNKREIDVLVARHVMGWSWYGFAKVYPPQKHGRGPGEWTDSEGNNHALVPVYSSSIAAAWEVADKFDGWFVIKEVDKVSGKVSYACRIIKPFKPEPVIEVADTAPLAICRAALRVKGIDIKKEEK